MCKYLQIPINPTPNSKQSRHPPFQIASKQKKNLLFHTATCLPWHKKLRQATVKQGSFSINIFLHNLFAGSSNPCWHELHRSAVVSFFSKCDGSTSKHDEKEIKWQELMMGTRNCSVMLLNWKHRQGAKLPKLLGACTRSRQCMRLFSSNKLFYNTSN